MRLGALINEGRRKGQPDEIDFPGMARLSEGTPSRASWDRYGREPDPEDLDHPKVKQTPWGGISTMTEPPDGTNVMGIAKATSYAPRTVWLACGESIGLPDMFPGGLDESLALLTPGWADLSRPRRQRLTRATAELVAEEELERELLAARARIAELEAELDAARPKARRR